MEQLSFDDNLDVIKEYLSRWPNEWKFNGRLNTTIITVFQDAINRNSTDDLERIFEILKGISPPELEQYIKITLENGKKISILEYAISLQNENVKNLLISKGFTDVKTPTRVAPVRPRIYTSGGTRKKKSKKYRQKRKSRLR